MINSWERISVIGLKIKPPSQILQMAGCTSYLILAPSEFLRMPQDYGKSRPASNAI
jgi:hypothetical protein